jgi:pyridoxine 5-phosphate synthase
VEILRQTVRTHLNLEMAATPAMVAIALSLKPDYVTLVPERREEVTTEGGLDVAENLGQILEVVHELQARDIPVSLFIDPDEAQIQAAAETQAQFIELHTGSYANAKADDQGGELSALRRGCELALEQELRINAGHGLTYWNVRPVAELPGMEELNIGHSIMSRAILVGMERAVREMKLAMLGQPF